MNPLEALFARTGKARPTFSGEVASRTHRGGVENTAELQRVLELPRYRWQDDGELEELRRDLEGWLSLPPRTDCRRRCGHPSRQEGCPECARAAVACVCRGDGVMHLRTLQVAALQAIHDHGGMLGPIRVGGGKTLLSFLAGVVLGAERVMLCVPAKLREKTKRDFALLRRHWRHPTRMHLMSYELLSRDRGVAELEAYRPDLVVADEAHKFKSVSAACTKRIRRYLQEQNPEAHYVDMSGTVTKRSILEYAHRLHWAIPDGLQALPRKYNEVRDWADAVDEKVSSAGRLMPGALLQFCNEGELQEIGKDHRKATAVRVVRSAYCRRLMTAPGVCGTEEQFDGAMSLILQGQELSPGPQVVEAFEGLRTRWELPDGQPIDMPATLWRHARSLMQGFYYVIWSQEGFNACLANVLSDNGRSRESGARPIGSGSSPKTQTGTEPIDVSCLSAIERNILRSAVPETARDTALVLACANLKRGKPGSSPGRCEPSMGSPWRSTRGSTQSGTAPAICAGRSAAVEANARGVDEAVSRLTMTMQQVGSAAFSVNLATDRSACWETVLRAYPALLPICEALIEGGGSPRPWLLARKAWAAVEREALKNFHDIDSPLGVVRAIDDGRIPWGAEPLAAWRAVKDTFVPETEACWIDDACLLWAAAWAKEHRGLIWVHEVAFGQRLSEVTGIPYYGAKGLCEGRPIEQEHDTCIASIQANSEGRNLQQFSENLIVSVPPGGAIWEQLLGRTHRDGQDADEVSGDVLLGCYEQWDAFRQARRDAEYIERTTAQYQKLNFADVTVVEEAEIEARHKAGDPLWSKANATFWENDEWTEDELRVAGMGAKARADLRRGQ